ncbi:cytochrome d ubiquinol oxidase subunit II [Bacillus alkalicellulosilyticus]|uniref:cytochrome d ubiquinol oxidase subunit II n=1 Tax=Alkalihalobacterium alkalicellulosilyticum TaxID=1912214 RepID=UPI000996BF32|nr:cytochrome d ubiquinol oxidase subunit II [Bacillus alkalicellulosilyticus]
MADIYVAATILWSFLFIYIILASIDFGAGFFQMTSSSTLKITSRFLSPVWEVINVFLVFFIVGLVAFFPEASYYYGTILLIPGSIAIILLALRGSYFAFSLYGSKESNLYKRVYQITGLGLAAVLSAVLVISEGVFINSGALHIEALLKSSLFWSMTLFSMTSVIYISASFFTYYSFIAKEDDSKRLFKKSVVGWGISSFVCAVFVVASLKLHNPVHYQNMLEIAWVFAIGVIALIWGIYFLINQHYGRAFSCTLLQFAIFFFGYGHTHMPFLLYPNVTLHSSFTNEAMAPMLLTAFFIGLVILLPCMYLLFRLFLFDRDYVQGNK